jgi:hypothetical protein
MADNDNPYERAISDLVAKIEERMKPILEDKRTVNKLCELAGMSPRYADAEIANTGSFAIKPDQFHAKPLATAVREYLTQRGPSDRGGLGAASVNEIFEALISGGYTADAADENNAKRGLRIALTKNSQTFYRLPGGAYGLLEWYPNAKPQDEEDEPKRGKRKRGRPPKSGARRGRPPKAKEPEKAAATPGGDKAHPKVVEAA